MKHSGPKDVGASPYACTKSEPITVWEYAEHPPSKGWCLDTLESLTAAAERPNSNRAASYRPGTCFRSLPEAPQAVLEHEVGGQA